MFVERVFRLGDRPATKAKWRPALTQLMKQAWSESIDVRPTFAEIAATLKTEIGELDPVAGNVLGDSHHKQLNTL
jgi:hypothetical protein